MVVDVPTAGLVEGGTDLHLGVVLEPDTHPPSHRVLLCFHRVDLLGLLKGLLQLGSGLYLGPYQDVPVDGLPRFRIADSGVPALPAAILPFSEITFPVGSALCHVGKSWPPESRPHNSDTPQPGVTVAYGGNEDYSDCKVAIKPLRHCVTRIQRGANTAIFTVWIDNGSTYPQGFLKSVFEI